MLYSSKLFCQLVEWYKLSDVQLEPFDLHQDLYTHNLYEYLSCSHEF